MYVRLATIDLVLVNVSKIISVQLIGKKREHTGAHKRKALKGLL